MTLRIDIDDIVDELLHESAASEQAKKMGLVHHGGPYYKDPKTDKVVAKSIDGGKELKIFSGSSDFADVGDEEKPSSGLQLDRDGIPLKTKNQLKSFKQLSFDDGPNGSTLIKFKYPDGFNIKVGFIDADGVARHALTGELFGHSHYKIISGFESSADYMEYGFKYADRMNKSISALYKEHESQYGTWKKSKSEPKKDDTPSSDTKKTPKKKKPTWAVKKAKEAGLELYDKVYTYQNQKFQVYAIDFGDGDQVPVGIIGADGKIYSFSTGKKLTLATVNKIKDLGKQKYLKSVMGSSKAKIKKIADEVGFWDPDSIPEPEKKFITLQEPSSKDPEDEEMYSLAGTDPISKKDYLKAYKTGEANYQSGAGYKNPYRGGTSAWHAYEDGYGGSSVLGGWEKVSKKERSGQVDPKTSPPKPLTPNAYGYPKGIENLVVGLGSELEFNEQDGFYIFTIDTIPVGYLGADGVPRSHTTGEPLTPSTVKGLVGLVYGGLYEPYTGSHIAGVYDNHPAWHQEKKKKEWESQHSFTLSTTPKKIKDEGDGGYSPPPSDHPKNAPDIGIFGLPKGIKEQADEYGLTIMMPKSGPNTPADQQAVRFTFKDFKDDGNIPKHFSGMFVGYLDSDGVLRSYTNGEQIDSKFIAELKKTTLSSYGADTFPASSAKSVMTNAHEKHGYWDQPLAQKLASDGESGNYTKLTEDESPCPDCGCAHKSHDNHEVCRSSYYCIGKKEHRACNVDPKVKKQAEKKAEPEKEPEKAKAPDPAKVLKASTVDGLEPPEGPETKVMQVWDNTKGYVEHEITYYPYKNEHGVVVAIMGPDKKLYSIASNGEKKYTKATHNKWKNKTYVWSSALDYTLRHMFKEHPEFMKTGKISPSTVEEIPTISGTKSVKDVPGLQKAEGGEETFVTGLWIDGDYHENVELKYTPFKNDHGVVVAIKGPDGKLYSVSSYGQKKYTAATHKKWKNKTYVYAGSIKTAVQKMAMANPEFFGVDVSVEPISYDTAPPEVKAILDQAAGQKTGKNGDGPAYDYNEEFYTTLAKAVNKFGLNIKWSQTFKNIAFTNEKGKAVAMIDPKSNKLIATMLLDKGIEYDGNQHQKWKNDDPESKKSKAINDAYSQANATDEEIQSAEVVVASQALTDLTEEVTVELPAELVGSVYGSAIPNFKAVGKWLLSPKTAKEMIKDSTRREASTAMFPDLMERMDTISMCKKFGEALKEVEENSDDYSDEEKDWVQSRVNDIVHKLIFTDAGSSSSASYSAYKYVSMLLGEDIPQTEISKIFQSCVHDAFQATKSKLYGNVKQLNSYVSQWQGNGQYKQSNKKEKNKFFNEHLTDSEIPATYELGSRKFNGHLWRGMLMTSSVVTAFMNGIVSDESSPFTLAPSGFTMSPRISSSFGTAWGNDAKHHVLLRISSSPDHDKIKGYSISSGGYESEREVIRSGTYLQKLKKYKKYNVKFKGGSSTKVIHYIDLEDLFDNATDPKMISESWSEWLIREMRLLAESEASEAAKKLGLTHRHGPYYEDSEGKVVAQSVDGGKRLRKVSGKSSPESGKSDPSTDTPGTSKDDTDDFDKKFQDTIEKAVKKKTEALKTSAHVLSQLSKVIPKVKIKATKVTEHKFPSQGTTEFGANKYEPVGIQYQNWLMKQYYDETVDPKIVANWMSLNWSQLIGGPANLIDDYIENAKKLIRDGHATEELKWLVERHDAESDFGFTPNSPNAQILLDHSSYEFLESLDGYVEKAEVTDLIHKWQGLGQFQTRDRQRRSRLVNEHCRTARFLVKVPGSDKVQNLHRGMQFKNEDEVQKFLSILDDEDGFTLPPSGWSISSGVAAGFSTAGGSLGTDDGIEHSVMMTLSPKEGSPDMYGLPCNHDGQKDTDYRDEFEVIRSGACLQRVTRYEKKIIKNSQGEVKAIRHHILLEDLDKNVDDPNMVLESKASDKAKKLGLTHHHGPYYADDTGEVVAMSVDGGNELAGVDGQPLQGDDSESTQDQETVEDRAKKGDVAAQLKVAHDAKKEEKSKEGEVENVGLKSVKKAKQTIESVNKAIERLLGTLDDVLDGEEATREIQLPEIEEFADAMGIDHTKFDIYGSASKEYRIRGDARKLLFGVRGSIDTVPYDPDVGAETILSEKLVQEYVIANWHNYNTWPDDRQSASTLIQNTLETISKVVVGLGEHHPNYERFVQIQDDLKTDLYLTSDEFHMDLQVVMDKSWNAISGTDISRSELIQRTKEIWKRDIYGPDDIDKIEDPLDKAIFSLKMWQMDGGHKLKEVDELDSIIAQVADRTTVSCRDNTGRPLKLYRGMKFMSPTQVNKFLKMIASDEFELPNSGFSMSPSIAKQFGTANPDQYGVVLILSPTDDQKEFKGLNLVDLIPGNKDLNYEYEVIRPKTARYRFKGYSVSRVIGEYGDERITYEIELEDAT